MTLTVTAQPPVSSVHGSAYRAYPAGITPNLRGWAGGSGKNRFAFQDARQGDSSSGQKSGASAKPKTLDLRERAA